MPPGALADGTLVDGPATLRQALLGYEESFVRTVTEKLLTYALGRSIEYYDSTRYSQDYRRGGSRRPPLVVDRARHRRERAVPDEEVGVMTMMISKKAIPRRMVLRGLGASVALPFLDGMVPALSALATTAATPTVRFGAVYVPNGMVMQNWTPPTAGAAFELSPILQPLAPFTDQMLVLSGLDCTPPLSSRGGSHSRARRAS